MNTSNLFKKSKLKLLTYGLTTLIGINSFFNLTLPDGFYNKVSEARAEITDMQEIVYSGLFEDELEEINNIKLPSRSITTPFWIYKKSIKDAESKLEIALNNALCDFQDVLYSGDVRTISIGLGLNGRSSADFNESLDKANESLRRYGLKAELGESVNMIIPNSINNHILKPGIYNSFAESYDLYFVWTEDDYSRNSQDWAVKPFEGRISFVDGDVKPSIMNEIIYHEVLRLMDPNKPLLNVKHGRFNNDYFKRPKIKTFFNNRLAEFKKPLVPLDSLEKGEDRILTVSLMLNDVSEDSARKYFEQASENYQTNFGIGFEITSIYTIDLDSWNDDEVFANFKRTAKPESDIYILLTSYDWDTSTDGPTSSISGKAFIDHGFAWVETCHEKRVEIINHEIAHLFNAKHVYKYGALMAPMVNKLNEWAPGTRRAILKNKYVSWDN